MYKSDDNAILLWHRSDLMMELESGHRNSVIKRRNPIEFGLVEILDEYLGWLEYATPKKGKKFIPFVMKLGIVVIFYLQMKCEYG
ncbi:hypothetical protein evm_011150 [Chilo suppressalis]|nr:hypothetical protein evm_011150 [Chilo suppressalis]